MAELNKTELYILKGLLSYSDFCSKFIEKVQPTAFSPEVGPIVKAIKQYHGKYNKSPPIDVLCDHALPKVYRGDEKLIDYGTDLLIEAKQMQFDKENAYDFLVDETKNFIKRSAIENALMEAMPLVTEGKMDEAVGLIAKANSINFDDSLGHDYFEDLEGRVERMKTGVDLMPTGMDGLDQKIGGGWHRKSLNIFGAGTNVGKTLVLSDITLKLIAQGYNGLYLSLEIYEDLLANRIDANLSDTPLSDLADNPDSMMETLLAIKERQEKDGKEFGRLIIKESAPGCMSANGVMTLVRELELKRNGFKPDFIIVDYIGLMVPNSSSFSDNTYGKLKTVAEELRAVGALLDVPVFSAVQVNRDAFGSKDIGLENTSDSMGIPMTADLMIMITREDGEANESLMKWHVAKSRFSRNGCNIQVGVTYDKMRLACMEEGSVNTDDDLVKVARMAKLNKSASDHIKKKKATEEKPNEDKKSGSTSSGMNVII